MKPLEKEELRKIRGGISEGAILGITAIVVFLLGALVGYENPGECNVK